MTASTETSLSNADFTFLTVLVKERTGIILRGERHRAMVQGRLSRRLRALRLTDFSEYCQLLRNANSDDEVLQVINAVTTNVTSFFREGHHFTHLHQALAAKNSGPIRIWSAACSSGEEPYSIAMTAMDALKEPQRYDLKILATDIDTNILEKARTGQYSTQALDALPKGYATKYTQNVPSQLFAINEQVRRLVHFKPLNLLDTWPVKGPFDMIFCRNVFIYFTQETQTEIAARFIDLLQPGGLLYIGHSENLLNLAGKVEHIGRTIYRKVM